MSNMRELLDFMEDIEAEPEIGDIVEIELGDTLIETTISEILEDGITVHIDETALQLMIDGKKQLVENMNTDPEIDEAKYQGREVQLGKPMAGDVKKSKVYVRGPKGNVVKVNFGDKTMRIKKSNPARRKSFRARHNCDNPGPRHKARYWSCRAW
jgi:hypothetical protein